MLYNRITSAIDQILLFDRSGSQSILSKEHARALVDMIDAEDLANPATTYQDAQCGTGIVMLTLAQRLMTALAQAIPNEQDRLSHIFKNQIYLSDIDRKQVALARANLLWAIKNRDFELNICEQDCFANTQSTTYVLGSIDFATTNQFVPYYQELCDRVIVITRANKHSYERRKIAEIEQYRFLGISKASHTPICLMRFSKDKQGKGVKFVDDQSSILVEDPKFLPGMDLKGFLYANEILSQDFEGYDANYGSIGRDVAGENPGSVPLIYGVGRAGEQFRDVIKVSKRIVTDREGLGKNKLVIIKNGNRGGKNCLKFAGPEYGVGETALWVEVKNLKEFRQIERVWDEPCYDKFIRILRETSPANGKTFWSQLPNIKYLDQIKEIYDRHYQSDGD